MGYSEWMAAEQDFQPQSTVLARLKTAVLERLEYQLIRAENTNVTFMNSRIVQ